MGVRTSLSMNPKPTVRISRVATQSFLRYAAMSFALTGP